MWCAINVISHFEFLFFFTKKFLTDFVHRFFIYFYQKNNAGYRLQCNFIKQHKSRAQRGRIFEFFWTLKTLRVFWKYFGPDCLKKKKNSHGDRRRRRCGDSSSARALHQELELRKASTKPRIETADETKICEVFDFEKKKKRAQRWFFFLTLALFSTNFTLFFAFLRLEIMWVLINVGFN